MSDIYPRFTVAAVQASPVMFDRDKTVEKAVYLIGEAAERGAEVIGFPELFIPGHPGIWYLCRRGNPLKVHGALYTELVENAVKVPSPATDRLCAAARAAHAYVVIGIVELDQVFPGTMYHSQLLISDEGVLLGVHRKMVLTFTEKLLFAPGDGSYLRVLDTPYGKLSAMSCGEHGHSLYKYAMLALGAQIHVASWPAFPDSLYKQSLRDALDFRVRAFAYEGKLFLINSCAVASQQNIDACCTSAEERAAIELDGGGGSSIIGPDGGYLAGPLLHGEGILTAEVSLADALPGKQLHDVLGHYARFDVLNLNFNREPQGVFATGADASGVGTHALVGQSARAAHADGLGGAVNPDVTAAVRPGAAVGAEAGERHEVGGVAQP